MELTVLRCPACQAEILDSHVDLTLGIARCGKCSRVMRLGAKAAAPRTAPAWPAGFWVDERGDEVEIRWRWLKAKHVGMLFFCVAWDAFLFFWYSAAFGGHGPWLMIVFPIAHVAVGVGLTYSTLAGFLNRTRVLAGRGVLRIRHGPLPWKGNRTLSSRDIDQLYCIEKVTRGDESTSYRYTVRAQLKTGPEVDLISDLEESGQALFLEHELERFLDIADRPVAGELPR
jgi:hypothetical protein